MGKLLIFPTGAPSSRLIPVAFCEHQVTGDGRVVCRKVGQGDTTEVAVALCATCPAALIQCSHLRFTLRQHTAAPMLVRRPEGGRDETWDLPPVMRFERATCARRPGTISSPVDCAGCTLRLVEYTGGRR